MKDYKLFPMNLSLFDGGAGASGATGASSNAAAPSGAGEEGEAQAAKSKIPGTSRGKKAGETILYGKQETDPAPAAEEKTEENPSGVTTTSNTLEAKKAEFDRLIREEYKDVYDERVQTVLKSRLKNQKELEGRLSAVSPVLDLLMDKYKVKNEQELARAIEQDDAYWEEGAEEAGLSVEQYKYMKKIERENAELQKAKQQAQQNEYARQQIGKWGREAEELKAEYPDFDLGNEMGDRNFVGMLRAGVPVKIAYEAIHINDVKAKTAQSAAKTAEKNVTENIRAKGARPQENGTMQSGGVIVKNDVSKLTREDRAEIAKRAMRGEKIQF